MPDEVTRGRISFVSMSYFDEVPRGQHIYYVVLFGLLVRLALTNLSLFQLKSILHMWSDEEALLILKNVRGAMHDTSKVLIR
jgi:hypothetical protein